MLHSRAGEEPGVGRLQTFFLPRHISREAAVLGCGTYAAYWADQITLISLTILCNYATFNTQIFEYYEEIAKEHGVKYDLKYFHEEHTVRANPLGQSPYA